MDVTFFNSDVLAGLAQIPDNTIHCCITSPPYWGLRDYKILPVIWGGDSNCEHHLDEYIRRRQSGGDGTASEKQISNTGSQVSKGVEAQAFCIKCGAWQGNLGLEPAPELYVQHLIEVFREVRRVLRPDGTLWLNLGDSYNGCGGSHKTGDNGLNPVKYGCQSRHTQELKPKDLCGIPWRVALALQADGWWLRQDIIWSKPNPMPESVTDRCTKSHEYIFLMTKSADYHYDYKAIMEDSIDPESYEGRRFRGRQAIYDSGASPGSPNSIAAGDYNVGKTYVKRNKRSVWNVNVTGGNGVHFATFPEKLITPCVLAGCPRGGVVCDPFMGTGTVGIVAKKNNCSFIGIELSEKFCNIAKRRIDATEWGLF